MRNIHVVSTYFFWCNIDRPKIAVFSMYLLRRNFDGWKIDVISMYFFQSNFNSLSMYYFDAILIKSLFWWIENWRNSDIVNLTFILAYKSLEGAFVSIKIQTYQKISVKVSLFNSFKKLSFVIMISFKFSSKFCWLSSVSLNQSLTASNFPGGAAAL